MLLVILSWSKMRVYLETRGNKLISDPAAFLALSLVCFIGSYIFILCFLSSRVLKSDQWRPISALED